MTDIALTSAQVAPVFSQHAEIVPMIAAAALTKGQIVYRDTDGKAAVADANDSGKEQARGVALNDCGAGAIVDVLKKGACYGFTVSGLDGDALVYLSDTAGVLADAVGTMTVPVGRIHT